MQMIHLEIQEMQHIQMQRMKQYDEFKFQNSQKIQRIYIEIEQKL